MRRILFVCARNRLRSLTAEAIFSGIPGIEASSAGTAPDAECPLSADLIEWADDIFCMEQRQKKALLAKFPSVAKNKRIVCLGIPDRYDSMQKELIDLLRSRVSPFLS